MRSFQSYLHGIEIEYELAAEVLKEKFQSYLHGIEIYHRQVKYDAADCSNRTFMELKFIRVIGVLRLISVPIVPSWN